MRGTEWYVKGDPRLRIPIGHHRGQKIPRTYSKLEWEQVGGALHPPPGMSNDDWISCEDYFENVCLSLAYLRLTCLLYMYTTT
ncbi:hypothetical protein EON64_07295, partial [archaeon]